MAHEKIHNLPCFQELHDRILAGVPLTDIVRWLQEEKGEFTDIKFDSVYKAIRRYREDLPPAELGLLDGHATQARLEAVEGDLDELDVLHRLVNLQIRRIARMEQREAQAGGVVNIVKADDIDVARKLLVQSAELKFKLGVYKERERSMTVNHSFPATQLLENLTPAERSRAAGLARSILPMLANVASAESPDAEDVPFELVTSTPLNHATPTP